MGAVSAQPGIDLATSAPPSLRVVLSAEAPTIVFYIQSYLIYVDRICNTFIIQVDPKI